jgi:hypothetical protein
MGLDITAYSHMIHVGKHEKDRALNEGEPGGLDDWCYYENHAQAFAYDSFPRSFRGIPILSTRTIGGNAKFLEGGCFEVTDKTETHEFRAGSYGGYGHWRQDLARQFNPAPILGLREGMQQPDPDLPFYELIWFADNEGSIGPEAAADLLADFQEHADRYDPADDQLGYMRRKYVDWTRAFELAAQDGLVHFH